GPLRPALQLFASTNQDSDDNDLSIWGGSYTHHVGARGEVGALFTHAQTDAQVEIDPSTASNSSATPVAMYDTLRLTGAWHPTGRFSLYGEAGPERTSVPFPHQPDPANTITFLGDPSVSLDDRTRDHLAGSLSVEVDPYSWLALVASGSQERLVG